MKAIILCAGKGERMRPLTENIPKPMIPIAGKPILEYLIHLCKKNNIQDIAINTSYLPEKIKEYFGNGSKFGVRLKYSFEPFLLGTSGALNNFREFFKGKDPFFVIYGDNITDLNLTRMLEFHYSKKALATLYLYMEKGIDPQTQPGWITMDENNHILEIVEKGFKKGINSPKTRFSRKLINAGVYILSSKILEKIPMGFSDFMKDTFPKLISSGKLYGYEQDCYFKELGQLSRYNLAKEDIESGRIKLE